MKGEFKKPNYNIPKPTPAAKKAFRKTKNNPKALSKIAKNKMLSLSLKIAEKRIEGIRIPSPSPLELWEHEPVKK